MTPAEVATDVKAAFPEARTVVHKGLFTEGFGVEIEVDGKVERNGWAIDNDTNWTTIRTKALVWLTSRYHS